MLTSAEIVVILRTLCPEGGYSADAAIAQLQAKLSIMLQVALDKEAA